MCFTIKYSLSSKVLRILIPSYFNRRRLLPKGSKPEPAISLTKSTNFVLSLCVKPSDRVVCLVLLHKQDRFFFLILLLIQLISGVFSSYLNRTLQPTSPLPWIMCFVLLTYLGLLPFLSTDLWFHPALFLHHFSFS